MTESVATSGRRNVAPAVAAVFGVVVILGSPFLTMGRVNLPAVAIAAGVAIMAQFGALRFRQGTRMIFFAWGEGALIVVVYLVKAGWVPLMIALGFLIGHSLFLLRTGGTWRRSRLYNITNLGIAGAAGAVAAHAVGMTIRAPMTPRLILALIVGGIAYFVVSSILLNVATPGPSDISLSVPAAIARTLNDKLPMVAGNITVGVLVVLLYANDRMWLFLVPPVAVLMHQAYVYRSRIADERRLWREFAVIASSLNQLDERSVAAAAIDGTLRLFDADVVEVWVDRSAASGRGYRGTANRRGEVVKLKGQSADEGEPPAATRALTIGGVRVGELRLWMPPGSSLDGRDQMALSAVADAVAAALHDALAQRALRTLAARSQHDSHQDVVTGIANRASLQADGADKLREAGDGLVTLFVLGINRFKEVNESLGPVAGDDLLRITAGRLAAFAEPSDLVARIGGDEFALMSELNGASNPVERATSSAQALAAELTVPTELAGIQVAVEVSVGVAVASAADCDMGQLVQRASIAMRRAKSSAGAVAVYGDADAPPSNVERLSVLVDMREALDQDDQLVLAIQPTVDLASGEPIAAEALIRWNHPRRGALMPREFVDLVDQSDLVVPFTRYVLGRALRLAEQWREQGLTMRVSVNLSPRSLADPNLPGDVLAMLKAHDIEPNMLTLEITESAAVTGQPIVVDVLAALRAHGVQLAVDDFGSGYSSLTFLARVQVDEVKVDSTFVNAMTDSAEAAAIVRTTVDLGKRLGLRVVAEGVETHAQRNALADLGCEAAQGWHITPPVPADHAYALMRRLRDSAGSA
ncbi:MAG TPA: bifunctional diguanylate cyclase/phosphodiesterase [Micromonosporaceae bacterium]|nr:bifunctional diguanylate cyclase/phosphodiesterase [Micromonosporaceae bacterium]